MSRLILHNDDESKFMDVVAAVIDICKYDPTHAEELVLSAHWNGECSIMNESKETLLAMKNLFDEKNITTSIND